MNPITHSNTIVRRGEGFLHFSLLNRFADCTRPLLVQSVRRLHTPSLCRVEEFAPGYYDWEAIANQKGITDPKEREEFIAKRKKKLKKKFKKWKKAQKAKMNPHQQAAVDAFGQVVAGALLLVLEPNIASCMVIRKESTSSDPEGQIYTRSSV